MNLISVAEMKKDKERGLRIIFGMNTIIHCHHYNSRVQNTVEQDKSIDGKQIIYSSARDVYFDLVTNAIKSNHMFQTKDFISELYQYLGFGLLDLSKSESSFIKSSSSHSVEGWRCGTVKRTGHVCSVTEGYLAGAFSAILGENLDVIEEQCMNEGHSECRFKLTKSDVDKKISTKAGQKVVFPVPESQYIDSPSNIDKQALIDAIVSLDIVGNEFGLIPAFNVYLANTPQDFYNLVTIRYLEEMEKTGRCKIAKALMIEDAEYCAMNTFYGILNSDEWSGLVAPMVKEPRDNIYGLVAFANAFGWGKILVNSHLSENHLNLVGQNGYEAYGYFLERGQSTKPRCYMLTGVASGLMSLVYRPEDLANKTGSYSTEEKQCMCCNEAYCSFETNG